jgi:hypothetical protein
MHTKAYRQHDTARAKGEFLYNHRKKTLKVIQNACRKIDLK